MRASPHRVRHDRGAALLTAMLTVALVATFATAALWQQWRSIEVETAERARIQSSWILTGALDWARLLLREDHIGAGLTGPDHLGEPWAVPLQEARLSSFLAADRNNTAETGPEVMDAFLSGQIVDMQSRLNVNTLVQQDAKQEMIVSPEALLSFERLFELLGLPNEQLEALAENLRVAAGASGTNRTGGMAPLAPKTVEQLVWLGMSPQTVAVLRPYVAVLPSPSTKVNLNTASAEVIYAVVPELSMAEAQQLVSARERSHFRRISDASQLLSGGAARMPDGQVAVSVASMFFEIRARLRLDQLVVEERSLVQRDGLDVKVLQRERGVPDPTASAQLKR
jgi:general secretion pathway protein K